MTGMDVSAVCDLLENDLDGWTVQTTQYPSTEGYLMTHALLHVFFSVRGFVYVDNLPVGWWAKFRLRRALGRRLGRLVGRHLEAVRESELNREMAEVRRLVA